MFLRALLGTELVPRLDHRVKLFSAPASESKGQDIEPLDLVPECHKDENSS